MLPDMDNLPRSTEWPFVCDCGREFTSTIYHAVNITLRPELLYTLLAGKLNVAVCPNCGRTMASPLPFVYHDMQRGLFAYVYPSAEVDDDEREQLVARLRTIYAKAVDESARRRPPRAASRPRRGVPSRPHDAASSPSPVTEPAAPPMQVIFGVDRLVSLIESLLEPEERLGRIALTTASHNAAERERLVSVARQLADQLGCQVEPSDRAGTFTVEVYGSRSQIGSLVQLLHSAS